MHILPINSHGQICLFVLVPETLNWWHQQMVVILGFSVQIHGVNWYYEIFRIQNGHFCLLHNGSALIKGPFPMINQLSECTWQVRLRNILEGQPLLTLKDSSFNLLWTFVPSHHSLSVTSDAQNYLKGAICWKSEHTHTKKRTFVQDQIKVQLQVQKSTHARNFVR